MVILVIELLKEVFVEKIFKINILRRVAVVASQSHKLKVIGANPIARNQVSKDFKNKHLSKNNN